MTGKRARPGDTSPAAETAGGQRPAGCGGPARRAQRRGRSVRAGMELLAGLREELGMTDACYEYAAGLFRKTAASGFLSGRTVSRCVAASALLACRKHDTNRTVADVARAAGLERRDVCRTYGQLCGMFEPDLPVPDPASLVAGICEKIGAGGEVGRHAREVLAAADGTKMAGKGPAGLAAGAVYVACVRLGEMVLRREIAEAAGVAETTLSNRYNELAAAATA